MTEMTRRQALAVSALITSYGQDARAPLSSEAREKNRLEDRKRVLAVGMTEQEADCWAAIADAAGKFFALPKLHSMDEHEVSHAIHVVQHKLLSRPAYRKYLELAKAGAK